MKNLSKKDLAALISRYLDGDLSGEEARGFEDYLSAHPEARAELEAFRRLKQLVASRRQVKPNPYLWSRISEAVKARTREEEDLLPFPRRYLPAAAALGIVAIAAIGTVVFLQREPLLRYFSKQSEAVQQAYESGLLKGSILPLFSAVDNDQVLQFAVYGTLPLDDESETALRVDETSDQGYQIEVGRTGSQHRRPVTVTDLMAEVQPTPPQAERIQSLLDEARQKIQRAAFYAENNALAIDPELTRLNREVLSNIVSVLEPVQRRKFDEFLAKRNAPFALASEGLHAASPASPVPPIKREDVERGFLVITEDSLAVVNLRFNLDSLLTNMPAAPPVPDMHVEHLQKNLERFVRSRAGRNIVVRAPVPGRHVPVHVSADEDFFKIEVRPTSVEETRERPVWVKPRDSREKFFRFEFRSSEGGADIIGVPGAEGGVHISIQIDSMLEKMQKEQLKRIEEFRAMDSLFLERVNRAQRIRRGRMPSSGHPDSVEVRAR